jgi:hypothetical protein
MAMHQPVTSNLEDGVEAVTSNAPELTALLFKH